MEVDWLTCPWPGAWGPHPLLFQVGSVPKKENPESGFQDGANVGTLPKAAPAVLDDLGGIHSWCGLAPVWVPWLQARVS